jgi:hypothetical protein
MTNTLQTISRADAKSAGILRFFTGKPCSQGHMAERYVSTESCCQCAAGHRTQYRMNNKAAIAEWAARYRARKRDAKAKALLAEAALAASVPAPEPAPTVYELPLAELANPPAPFPDEAVARLKAAAARRKLAHRRKLSASIARGRRVSPTAPPAPMPPTARPLPAHAVQTVEAPTPLQTASRPSERPYASFLVVSSSTAKALLPSIPLTWRSRCASCPSSSRK